MTFQSNTEQAASGLRSTNSGDASTKHTPTPWIESGSHDFRGANMDLVGMANPTVRQGKIDRAFIVKAVNSHAALVKALTDTLCELTACASQLAARGLKGHEGDSVSQAQKAARDALSNI